jgi:hypothetical protein
MFPNFKVGSAPEPLRPNVSFSQMNTDTSKVGVEFMGKKVSSDFIDQDDEHDQNQKPEEDPIISVNLDDFAKGAHIRDMQRAIMKEREFRGVQSNGQLAAQVQFHGDDDSPCLHNLFLSVKNQDQQSLKLKRLEDNSIQIKFIPREQDEAHSGHDDSLEMKKITLKSSDIISKFFNYLKLYTKGLIKKNHLKKIVFGTNELKINYKKIKLFLLNFFQIEDFRKELESLNKFEMMFVGIILNKKKYLKWKDTDINFATLQNSSCKIKKPKLFKFFLNFFVKHLIKKHNAKSKGISFQKQSENFFNYIFGPNQIPQLKNEQSFTQALKSIKPFVNSFSQHQSNKNNCTEEELLKKFTKIIVSQGRFKSFVSNRFLDKTTKMMFEDYKSHKMQKVINKIVDSFEKKLDNSVDKVDGLLDYYIALKTNSKFNGIWTFKEFQQGKEVFLEYACY